MTRTERQKQAIKNWIKAKGKGTIIGSTGFGKTRIALMTIQALLKKYPQLRILVVVPTETLKNQWITNVDEWGFQFNVEIGIINTIIKHSYTCDMLVIDEIHRIGSDCFYKVFECVKYKLILGLTATIERLDGKHILIKKHCPVVDEINTLECLANGWISNYKEYQVLIDVDDLDVYKKYNKEFQQHFEFFHFDFNLAMSMTGNNGWKNKLKYLDEIYKGDNPEERKYFLQQISYHSAGLMRTMQQRKAFINNHPKKIEIAKKIIKSRPDSKIITFSNNVKMAESIENGQNVYTGRTSKKRSNELIEKFLSGEIKTLNSCQRLNEGFDCPDTSVAIILGFDSSEIKSTQRRGRVSRRFGDKVAEIFYIVINNTQELKWFTNSHTTTNNYITIDEQGLEQVLKGEQPTLYKKKLKELRFRF